MHKALHHQQIALGQQWADVNHPTKQNNSTFANTRARQKDPEIQPAPGPPPRLTCPESSAASRSASTRWPPRAALITLAPRGSQLSSRASRMPLQDRGTGSTIAWLGAKDGWPGGVPAAAARRVGRRPTWRACPEAIVIQRLGQGNQGGSKASGAAPEPAKPHRLPTLSWQHRRRHSPPCSPVVQARRPGPPTTHPSPPRHSITSPTPQPPP